VAARLIGLVAIGAALRLYHLTAISLWYDEAVSLHLVDAPWPETLHRIHAEIGPPLYFILLKLWTAIVGPTTLGLRSFSVVCGLAAIPAACLVASDAFDSRRAGLVAALLFAVNPLQIQYSDEGRAYALGVFLALVSSAALIRAIRSGRFAAWMAYAALSAACLYTHYYLLFVIAGHAVVIAVLVIVRPPTPGAGDQHRIVGPLLGFATAAALFAPWFPEFLRERQTIAAEFWVERVDAATYLDITAKLLVGVRDVSAVFTGTALVAAIATLVYVLVSQRRWESWVILAPILITGFGSLPLFTGTRAVVDRYFAFAGALLLVLVSRALSSIRPAHLSNAAVALAALASLGAFADGWRQLDAVSLVHLSRPVRRPGTAGAARRVNDGARSGDRIVVASSLIYFPFRRYNRTGIDPQLFADRPLAEFPAYAGRDLLTEAELVYDWKTVPAGSHVWLVWTNGYQQAKPTLPSGWRLIESQQFPDAPDFKGSVFVDEYVAG
jgi:hypothetical protein